MPLQRAVKDLAAIKPHFRRDINGLRAWAVMAVMLYHFGIAGFSGGFIGVDVFFVISGFLMTGIIVRGLERDDFSFIGFYMARARRIVPALAILCAVLLVLGWFVLLPPDYLMLGNHTMYSLSFLSNIEYWKEAGYFDVASQEKWLLHTWSLSVEWQFYLVFPIVLAGIWRVLPGRAAQRWTLLVGIVLSFAASVLMTRAHPAMAFYLLPARLWELLAGGLVCLLAAPASATARRWMELAGLLLLVLSITLLDNSTAWPGGRAALPVVGAMLILSAERISPWTGNAVAQWLGNRSYSLYLWHWPVVVALAYVERLHDPAWIGAGLSVTFLLGHCSYVWIESATRSLFGRMRLGYAAVGMACLAGAVAVPGLAVWALHGVAKRFPADIEQVAAEAKNINLRGPACHTKRGVTSPSCMYGGTEQKVFAIGDSHANALVSAIAAAAPDANAGVVQWTYSGCAFVPGLKMTPAFLATQAGDYQCSGFGDWVQSQLDVVAPGLPVVIINRYALAAMGHNEDGVAVGTPLAYFSNVTPTATPAFLAEFSKHIIASACRIAQRRPVYLMRPIPEMGMDVPRSLARRMAFGVHGDISIPLAAYRQRNGWVWAAQDAAHAQCGITILDPLPYLCHDGRCYGSKDGHPLYVDDNHLSESGNKLLVPMFAAVFTHR